MYVSVSFVLKIFSKKCLTFEIRNYSAIKHIEKGVPCAFKCSAWPTRVFIFFGFPVLILKKQNCKNGRNKQNIRINKKNNNVLFQHFKNTFDFSSWDLHQLHCSFARVLKSFTHTDDMYSRQLTVGCQQLQ